MHSMCGALHSKVAAADANRPDCTRSAVCQGQDQTNYTNLSVHKYNE